MFTSRILPLSLGLSLLSLSCGPGDPVVQTYDDEATICVGTNSLGQSDGPLEPGDTVIVTAIFDECISACARNVETSCEVETAAGGVRVSTSASFEHPPPDTTCTMQCVVLHADCGEVTLDDGELLIHHGDDYHYFAPGEGGRCALPEDAEEPRARQVLVDNPAAARPCLGEVRLPGFGEVEILPGEPFDLLLDLGLCLSSSCSEELQTQCTHTVDGDEIHVAVSGSYGDLTYLEEGSCTDDCGIHIADCGELTLPEGQYTLHYAGNTYPFELPDDDAGCL